MININCHSERNECGVKNLNKYFDKLNMTKPRCHSELVEEYNTD